METNSEKIKPKIWKVLILSWIYAFIVINITFAVLGPIIINLHPIIRSVIITTILVPAMGLGGAALQRKFHQWLSK